MINGFGPVKSVWYKIFFQSHRPSSFVDVLMPRSSEVYCTVCIINKVRIVVENGTYKLFLTALVVFIVWQKNY